MATQLTVKDRIEKFIKKYPEPIMPTTDLWWERRHENKHYRIGNDPIGIYIKAQGKIIYQYYKYDKELELCELAIVTLDHHVLKANEERKWEYKYRYFIPKGTRELYDSNGVIPSRYFYERVSYSGSTYSVSEFAHHFTNLNRCQNMFETELLPFVGRDLEISGRWCSVMTTHWHLEYWFKTKWKTRTSGSVQKAIDELTATELPPIYNIYELIHRVRGNDTRWKKDTFCYFDAENQVFRCYLFISDDNIIEQHRIYLTSKRPYVTTKALNGEWVTNGSFTCNRFNHTILNPEDVYKIPHGDYLKTLIQFMGGNPNLYKTISIIKHPEIEQLVNMGLPKIASKIARSDNIHSQMKELFGNSNKAKSVCKKYGITKKQLEYLDKWVDNQRCYLNVISRIKNILQTDNISSLDFDTYVKYFNALKDMDFWRWRSLNNDPGFRTIFNRLVNMSLTHNNAMHLYLDAVQTYNYLTPNNRPAQTPHNFKNYNELVRLHNMYNDLLAIQREEENRLNSLREEERRKELEKKMVKLDKERVKLNYEEDDFIIRIPEKLIEIANEGSALHHCVGGYTQRHAQGQTTIIFLRRKSNPNKPFYTIEVSPQNKVVQIHGFGNRWLGNDPDAIPTVMRWLKLHDISCTDQILLSTATGYCGNSNFVAKPII